MSLRNERRQARKCAQHAFAHPDEPWTEQHVYEHLKWFAEAARDDSPNWSPQKAPVMLAGVEAYCAEFERLWAARKARAVSAHV